MCDFNNLTDEEKLHFHTILITAANNYGGLNFFLQLAEALREPSPHVLTSPHQDFLFDLGDVRWGKTIFNDKVLLIKESRINRAKEESFLPHDIYPDVSSIASIRIGYTEQVCEGMDVLINLSKTVPTFFEQFKRIADIVENSLRESGRNRYRFYKDRNYELRVHEIK
jgi:hypothetical protein